MLYVSLKSTGLNSIMQLNKQTDLAFRLIYFLYANNDRRTTIKEVSDYFSVSKSHMMKVANKLVHANIVVAARGKSGGLFIARAASSISLREVVETMEETLELVNCQVPSCLLIQNCALKGALDEAKYAFLQVLEQKTMADIITGPIEEVLRFECD